MQHLENKFSYDFPLLINQCFYWLKENLEWIFWIGAVFLLFFMPFQDELPSLCVYHALGWENCFGCGIGRSIHYCLNGQWQESWNMHVFGIPATCIIFIRIIQIRPRKSKLHATT